MILSYVYNVIGIGFQVYNVAASLHGYTATTVCLVMGKYREMYRVLWIYSKTLIYTGSLKKKIRNILNIYFYLDTCYELEITVHNLYVRIF